MCTFKKISIGFLIYFTFFSFNNVFCQKVDLLKPIPLSEKIRIPIHGIRPGPILVPVMTRPSSLLPVFASQTGIFDSENLDYSFYKEDNFTNQINNCLRGLTPYLTGTLGQINAAAPVFKKAGSELVVIYMLSESNGFDNMVVKDNKEISSIKSIALQLYGPHMDYAGILLNQLGLLDSSVHIQWFTDLTVPQNSSDTITDPVSAFYTMDSIDAVMCISPDADFLTHYIGNQKGEISQLSARLVHSTDMSDKIIVDVYAVRKDYLEDYPVQVYKFCRSLAAAKQNIDLIVSDTLTYKGFYDLFLHNSSSFLFDTTSFSTEVSKILKLQHFSGYQQNKDFFSSLGTRNYKKMCMQIQSSFLKMGVLSDTLSISWLPLKDSIIKSLQDTIFSPVAITKFDSYSLYSVLANSLGHTQWKSSGLLSFYAVDVKHSYNRDVLETLLQLAEINKNAVIILQGYQQIAFASESLQKSLNLSMSNHLVQQAKNTSLSYAESLKISLLKYAKQHHSSLDPSRILVWGAASAVTDHKARLSEVQIYIKQVQTLIN